MPGAVLGSEALKINMMYSCCWDVTVMWEWPLMEISTRHSEWCCQMLGTFGNSIQNWFLITYLTIFLYCHILVVSGDLYSKEILQWTYLYISLFYVLWIISLENISRSKIARLKSNKKPPISWYTFSNHLKQDICFTILCWFLPHINMNQPLVYVFPLPLKPYSYLPPPPTPLDCHRALGWTPCVTTNSHWLFHRW